MYDLTVSPKQAEAAMRVLQEYVAERAALLVITPGADKCQIDTVLQAVRMMDALFMFKEILQKAVKTPAEAAYDVLRFTVVPNLMESDEVTTLSIAGVGRVNLQDDVSVKVKDQKGLTDWLVDNELEDIIKPTVNAQTLTALVRKRLKAGDVLPGDTIMETKPLVRAVITRAGVK